MGYDKRRLRWSSTPPSISRRYVETRLLELVAELVAAIPDKKHLGTGSGLANRPLIERKERSDPQA